MSFNEILDVIVDYAWGLPLVCLLLGGGFYLLFVSRFAPILLFSHAFKLLLGKYVHSGDDKASGQLSSLKCLSNALAATIGLGNIAGVAIAITQGGPGAIFWMWLTALIGMNTKFFECSLAALYRKKDYLGEVQGGPMYTIDLALGKKFKFLSVFFSVCGLVGTLSLFQSNQVAEFAFQEFSIPKVFIGITFAIVSAIALMGGLKRLSNITSALVPTMTISYILIGIIILIINYEKVPSAFISIFVEAFSPSAIFGGAVGIGFIEVMKIGIKRAAFSNEAGMGTAAMAHGNIKTSEPVSEGLVAMLGPFIDTVIICTITALIILTNKDGIDAAQTGILMTQAAFNNSIPYIGTYFLLFFLIIFSLTTVLGMANYNEKCFNYVFKGKGIFKRPLFIIYYSSSLILGTYISMQEVVNILDIAFAFMAVPNMIATILLAPKIKLALNNYFIKIKN